MFEEDLSNDVLILKDKAFQSDSQINDNYILNQPQQHPLMCNQYHIKGNQPLLLKKLTEMNKSKCLILFNFFVLITFNINFAHFCLRSINNALGILPTGFILILMMAFSFIFQSSFVSFLIKSKAFNFGKLIEAHFGSLSAMIYEIISVLWLCLCFLSTFGTCDRYLSLVIGEEDGSKVYQYAISGGFFIILLVINSCQSKSFINFGIVLSFLIHFLNFGLFIYSLANLKANEISFVLINFHPKESDYFEAFSALSSVMNTIIILFWVNIRLKKDFNYSERESRILLVINYIFNFAFYATYIFEGIFQYNESDSSYQHYLLYLYQKMKREDTTAQIVGHLFIGMNIAYEIFLTTFYFFVLKNMIFRTKTREFFSEKKYYFYFTPLLLIVLVLSLGLDDPYRIILINNSTFGFLVNFIFPCKCFI